MTIDKKITGVVCAIALTGLVGLAGFYKFKNHESHTDSGLQTVQTPQDDHNEAQIPLTIQNQKRFTHYNLEDLTTANVPLPIALKYDDRFRPFEIIEMHKHKVSPETSHLYNSRFCGAEIVLMTEAHVAPEMANSYDEFSGSVIARFSELGLKPDVVNQYAPRFKKTNGNEIIELASGGVQPEAANAYDEHLNVRDIYLLHKAGITAEESNAYFTALQKTFGDDLAHCSASDYISELSKAGIPPTATAYDNSFWWVKGHWGWSRSCQQVIALHAAGITAEDANRFATLNRAYGSQISPDDIIFFHSQGITYERVEKEIKETVTREKIWR